MKKIRLIAFVVVSFMCVATFAQSRAQMAKEGRNPNHPFDVGMANPNSSRNKGNIKGFSNDYPYYSHPQGPDMPRMEFWRFSGTIGSYSVQMELSVPYKYDTRGNQYGDNCMMGRYYYTTHPGQYYNLVLRSYSSYNGYIVLDEYDGPRRMGHIEGTITRFGNGEHLKGYYYNAYGQKKKVKLTCTGLMR
ncbi:MAG: hypothetical protein Q4F34_06345 [Prevotellaceae bacterium]|nr:hypothetical protein [Prevotellaceae bacterium]